MVRKGLVTIVFLFTAVYLEAQPKVAVLDAVLGVGVPVNASAIVADTINEQFVKSPDFIALERAYISSVQEEKRFQFSGDVKEEDIKEIGNTFGADYLCIANVSLLGSTYTVSARLIEVSTAEVYAQESHRMRGEIDILFMIAEIVGAELVGADLAVLEAVPETVQEPESRPEPEEKPEPARESQEYKEPKEYKTSPARGHFMVSLMFPKYYGADDFVYFDGSYYDLYEMDDYVSDRDSTHASNENFGLDFHYMEPAFGFIYYSIGFTWTRQRLTEKESGNTYEWDIFSTYEPYAGLGAVISPISFVQLYGGVTLGTMILVMGTDSSGSADSSFWSSDIRGEGAFGITFGAELGADFYWGPFGLDLRYRWTRSREMYGESIFPDGFSGDNSFGQRGFMIGIGFMF